MHTPPITEPDTSSMCESCCSAVWLHGCSGVHLRGGRANAGWRRKHMHVSDSLRTAQALLSTPVNPQAGPAAHGPLDLGAAVADHVQDSALARAMHHGNAARGMFQSNASCQHATCHASVPMQHVACFSARHAAPNWREVGAFQDCVVNTSRARALPEHCDHWHSPGPLRVAALSTCSTAAVPHAMQVALDPV